MKAMDRVRVLRSSLPFLYVFASLDTHGPHAILRRQTSHIQLKPLQSVLVRLVMGVAASFCSGLWFFVTLCSSRSGMFDVWYLAFVLAFLCAVNGYLYIPSIPLRAGVANKFGGDCYATNTNRAQLSDTEGIETL